MGVDYIRQWYVPAVQGGVMTDYGTASLVSLPTVVEVDGPYALSAPISYGASSLQNLVPPLVAGNY